jgi:hypothetical protein
MYRRLAQCYYTIPILGILLSESTNAYRVRTTPDENRRNSVIFRKR